MVRADIFSRAAVLDDASAGLRDRLVTWRHHLHANPELSNREQRTGAFVAGRLREAGLDEVRTDMGGSTSWARR